MSKLIILNDGSSSYHGDELDDVLSKCTACNMYCRAFDYEYFYDWVVCPRCGSKIDAIIDVPKLRKEKNARYPTVKKVFNAKYELRYKRYLSKWIFYGSFENTSSTREHIKHLKYVTENYGIQLVSITDGKVVWSWSRRKNEQENR